MRFPRIPTLVYLAVMLAAAAALTGAKTELTPERRLDRLERKIQKLDRYLANNARVNAVALRYSDAERAATGSAATTGSPSKEPPGTLLLSDDEVCPALTSCQMILAQAVEDLEAEIKELEAAGSDATDAKNELAGLGPYIAIVDSLDSLIEEEVKAEREAGGDTSAVTAGPNCAVAQAELVAIEAQLESYSSITYGASFGPKPTAGGY